MYRSKIFICVTFYLRLIDYDVCYWEMMDLSQSICNVHAIGMSVFPWDDGTKTDEEMAL